MYALRLGDNRRVCRFVLADGFGTTNAIPRISVQGREPPFGLSVVTVRNQSHADVDVTLTGTLRPQRPVPARRPPYAALP
jgi:hypothetical protein